MYNPYQQAAQNPYGRPPEFSGFPGQGPPPPGMGPPPPPGMSAAPGTAAAPGMPQQSSPPPGRPGGFPPNFQPPANMPNINFSAPVIRLGTSGPQKPGLGAQGERAGESSSRRPGLGAGQSMESQRQTARESLMSLQPPSKEEVSRTVFVGGITEGCGGDEGLERILGSAGNLRRWTRAMDADNKACKFGFAEYEDPESLSTAAEVLRDVEVPVKLQTPHGNGDVRENGEVERSKLLIVFDDNTLSYIEQFESSRGDQDPITVQLRLENARTSLAAALNELLNPSVQAQKEDQSTIDRDGDVAMQDGVKSDGPQAEIVTIPITVEDELSEIPAEMRETVAKEIAAFRDRSNRRDLERLKREEEVEAMERARNAGSRNRLSSPPLSAPVGPGGANGIPIGPRDRGILNAPVGPKGFGQQIPRDYQKGVSFVNGTGVNGASGTVDHEDEDTDASDEELERRRIKRKDAENEKRYLDQERRWLNRERTRTNALEREKLRDDEEGGRILAEKEAMSKRMKEWNDDVEASRKIEEYYADRSAWIRNRTSFRGREIHQDDLDRAAEEREKARTQQQTERARGMADDFLARQAEEMEARTPREPQRFKLSLGAAAQKVQQTNRRTVAEVEGLLEDEEEGDNTAKRTLIPIKFDNAAEAQGLSDEERQQAVRQLAADIPSTKDGLWAWDVSWEFVDETILREQLKPFVEKKIVEYLGVQEQMLVDVVEEQIRKRGKPQELVQELEGALDEEAEALVKKLWRMIIFFSESEKRGLSA